MAHLPAKGSRKGTEIGKGPFAHQEMKDCTGRNVAAEDRMNLSQPPRWHDYAARLLAPTRARQDDAPARRSAARVIEQFAFRDKSANRSELDDRIQQKLGLGYGEKGKGMGSGKLTGLTGKKPALSKNSTPSQLSALPPFRART